jgi:hypothetical protein
MVTSDDHIIYAALITENNEQGYVFQHMQKPKMIILPILCLRVSLERRIGRTQK